MMYSEVVLLQNELIYSELYFYGMILVMGIDDIMIRLKTEMNGGGINRE